MLSQRIESDVTSYICRLNSMHCTNLKNTFSSICGQLGGSYNSTLYEILLSANLYVYFSYNCSNNNCEAHNKAFAFKQKQPFEILKRLLRIKWEK